MRGVVISCVFHTLLVLAVAMGLPFLQKTPVTTAQTMTVDVVRLSEITQATKGEKPKPKTEKTPDSDRDTTKKQVARDQASAEKPKPAAKPSKPEPKQTAQKPVKPATKPVKPAPSKTTPPKKQAPPSKQVEIDPRALKKLDTKPAEKKPAPDKKPEKKPAKQLAKATPTEKPKDQQKADTPKIAAKPRLRPRFKPQEQKKPKQVTQKPPEKKVAKTKPVKKPVKKTVTAQRKKRPEKRNALDSVFKSVKKFKRTAREESDRDRTAARKPTGSKSAKRSQPMSLSEIDAVRHQIKPCWRFPVGAKNAASLRVLIKLWMDRDGTVRRAQVMDRARMTSDSHFRAAAEAGRRAVMNPACSPLKLPAAKYDRWKVLIIDFDPSKLRTG